MIPFIIFYASMLLRLNGFLRARCLSGCIFWQFEVYVYYSLIRYYLIGSKLVILRMKNDNCHTGSSKSPYRPSCLPRMCAITTLQLPYGWLH